MDVHANGSSGRVEIWTTVEVKLAVPYEVLTIVFDLDGQDLTKALTSSFRDIRKEERFPLSWVEPLMGTK